MRMIKIFFQLHSIGMHISARAWAGGIDQGPLSFLSENPIRKLNMWLSPLQNLISCRCGDETEHARTQLNLLGHCREFVSECCNNPSFTIPKTQHLFKSLANYIDKGYSYWIWCTTYKRDRKMFFAWHKRVIYIQSFKCDSNQLQSNLYSK